MGLDMYLTSINKKLHQEDMEDYSIYNERNYDLQINKDFIEEYESCPNVKDLASKRFERKLNEYEKWDTEGRNKKSFEHYISNIISNETLKFSDFKTKEDLLNHYAKELEKTYFAVKEEMKYFDSEEWETLRKKFDGVKEKEEYYWRKHSDLNGYFSELASKRGISDSFNGEYLVLEEEDVQDLVDLVNKQLSGDRTFEVSTGFFWGSSSNSDWESTADVFEKILNEFDFENNTLIYRCSW